MKSPVAHRSITIESLESRQMLDATHLSIISQPQDAIAGNTLGTIKVLVLDGDNHRVTSDTSAVTLAITDGTGGEDASLSGTATVSAVNGVATFTGVNITTAGGDYTLTASDDSLDSDTSDEFDITPSAQTGLTFHQGGSDTTAGDVITDPVVVYAVDKYNNIVTDDDSTVTIGLNNNAVSLDGTVAVTMDDGVGTFDDISTDTAGTYKLVTAQGKITASSDNFNINADSAQQLGFVSATKTGDADHEVTAVINVQDQYGNLCTTNTDNVAVYAVGVDGINGNSSAVGGIATITFRTHKAGTFQLGARWNGNVTALAPNTTVVAPGAAAGVRFRTAPVDSNAAGNPLAVTAIVVDQYQNVVTGDKSKITIALNPDNHDTPDGARLLGTATVAAVAGVANFTSLNLTTPGSYGLVTSDGSLYSTTTGNFTVVPGAASKLVFTQAPTAVAAGAAMTAVKVVAQDKFGNTITADASKYTLAVLTAPTGASTGTVTTARASSGVASFSKIVMNKAGSYVFKVSSGKLAALSSSAITVNPASSYKIVRSTGPAAAAKLVAGSKITAVTAQIQDKFGNIATGDSSTITASIVGNTASLGGTASVAAVKGIATFSTLAINTAYDYQLKFASGSLKTARSNGFTVTPGAAAKLYLPASPTDTTAGDTIDPLGVFILDAFNNQVSTDASKVTVAITGPTGAKLTGTTTVTASSGFAGFTNLVATLAGTGNKLTFTDGKLTAAVSSTFAVTADEASKVVFTTAPVGTSAGATLANIVAKVEDQYGNVVTSDTSDVTIEPITAPVDADDLDGTTTQSAVAGVATFNDLKLTTAGSYTLKVSDDDLTTATSSAIAIAAGPASKLVVTHNPSDAAAGATLGSMTVQVEDAYDNVVTTDASKITAAITTGSGTSGAALTGTATATAVKGIATFAALSITTAGEAYTIKFTDASLTTDTTDAFDIAAGAAAKLVFGQAPSNVSATEHIGPAITVNVEDKYGNVVTDNTSNITLAIATGTTGATLGGTKTVAAEDGIATFDDLTLDKAGNYTLKATDGSLTAIISPTFKITASA